MKTICTLNGRIIMSQDGEALEAMRANAAQHRGAVVGVVTDEEYASLIATQPKTKDEIDAPILAQMAAADLKAIRALVEGDTVRITAHVTAQAALRAKLLP